MRANEYSANQALQANANAPRYVRPMRQPAPRQQFGLFELALCLVFVVCFSVPLFAL
jgi:hypothetical protein